MFDIFISIAATMIERSKYFGMNLGFFRFEFGEDSFQEFGLLNVGGHGHSTKGCLRYCCFLINAMPSPLLYVVLAMVICLGPRSSVTVGGLVTVTGVGGYFRVKRLRQNQKFPLFDDGARSIPISRIAVAVALT